jgi:hypothetical protein
MFLGCWCCCAGSANFSHESRPFWTGFDANRLCLMLIKVCSHNLVNGVKVIRARLLSAVENRSPAVSRPLDAQLHGSGSKGQRTG